MFNKLYVNTKNYIKENLWFFISLIIILLVFNFELPYYVESPGGFISLNDRVKVENSNSLSGDYGMAYVTMLKGTLPILGFSYLNNDWDIVPKDDVMYEDENLNTMNEREKISLNEGVANAKVVALKEANKEYEIKDIKLYITYIQNDDTELKMLDIIKRINGVDINNLDDVKRVIYNTNEHYVTITVIRNNKEMDVKSSIYELEGNKYIGIMATPNYDVISDPKIDVSIKSNESGSSGGLMLALAIYSKITNEDLTKGDKIIGTGTIDINGNVGEIAGVKYKLIGAVKNKAKVFLCTKDNYEEAISIAKERNYDIEIVNVNTFSDAINYLKGR